MEAFTNHVLQESTVANKDNLSSRSSNSPFRQINNFLLITPDNKKHYLDYICQKFQSVTQDLSARFTCNVFVMKLHNTLGLYNLIE
jgi:hypothetical protein